MRKRNVLALLVAVAMLACVLPASAEGAAYSEAPMLQAKTAAGELPAVAERLPAAGDVMVEPMDAIGQYGESITFVQDSSKWYSEKITEEPLFRFKEDGTVEPNVAKGFEVNEDATVYTIHLREGMKWSDGAPFTTEDCRFFYEDLLIPGVTGKSVWEAMYSTTAEGEKVMATMDVVDDYTFTVTFASPKPTFLEELAINGKWFFAPKHYLKDYIPGEGYLTAEQAAAKAEELGFSDTQKMCEQYTYYYWLVQGRPTLRPWVIAGDFEAELCVWERNPYYWKTDADGKQLPYIDTLRFMRFSDVSQKLLWTMDGTADVNDVTWDDFQTVMDADNDGVLLVEWKTPAWSKQSLQLNQAIQDEDLRALFQNIKFREALSICVNREQIVELVDNGVSTPAQSAPFEGSLGYSEEWTKKWTAYDPARAETLLAECGLVKGADGLYAFADGKAVVLNIQYQNELDAKFAELLMNDFKAIGLNTTIRMYDRSILEEMRSANTHEVTINWEKFDTVNLSLRPDYFIPFRDYCAWGTAFGLWYKNPADELAVEPPQDVKDMLNLYDKMMAATTAEARTAAAEEIMDVLEAGVYEIGYTSALGQIFAIDAKLRNFPDSSVYCDEYRGLGIGHPQIWWFDAE